MEGFNTGNNGTCRFKILKSKHWTDYFLYKSMILFDYVIEILNLPVLSSAGETTTIDKLVDQNFICIIFICSNNSGDNVVTGFQGFIEEITC